MVHQAAANPQVGIIGGEPYINGVAMLLGKIRHAGVDNLCDPSRRCARPVRRAARGLGRPGLPALSRSLAEEAPPPPPLRDARNILAPLARVDAAGCRFCGWPPTSPTTSARRSRRCRRRVSTGWPNAPADWRQPWDDWLSTRYEQKALREGRLPHYLTFRATGSVADAVADVRTLAGGRRHVRLPQRSGSSTATSTCSPTGTCRRRLPDPLAAPVQERRRS